MSPTTTADAAQYAALVAAQAQVRQQATAGAVAMAQASAQGFTGWYDSNQITVWAAALAVQMEAWQRSVATSTDAYLARALSLLVGSRVAPVGRVDVAELRQGVTHAGAYARAADVYRYQQSQFDQFTRQLATQARPEPFPLADPVQAAVDRVSAVADMDVQLADQAQTARVYGAAAEKGLITGWRRVIHPEQSRGGSCGLCVAASDRLYGPTELKPLHSLCKCTTLAVRDGADPGSVLNRADLNRLYREAGSTNRKDLTQTRYQVDEHGELGPLLNKQGVKVRTARQAKRDTSKPQGAVSGAERLVKLRRLRESMDPALVKARALAAGDPQKWGRYLSTLEDRIKGLDQQLAA